MAPVTRDDGIHLPVPQALPAQCEFAAFPQLAYAVELPPFLPMAVGMMPEVDTQGGRLLQ